MADQTKTGKATQTYIRNVLSTATKAGNTAIDAGYPVDSAYTNAYYAGIPYLYQYGDAQQADALARMGSLYDAYGAAGGYNKTNFSDIDAAYAAAGQYGPMRYGDLEAQYGGIGAYTPTSYADIANRYTNSLGYNATQYGDLESQYGDVSNYTPTSYDDLSARYEGTLGYDPRKYGKADYTTQNIKDRMNPYEELVSDRQRKRLKKAYDEGRGEREASAVRQGAFGGSGAAVQEEVARRNYLEQMADMDAQNLQNAYESGIGTYGREMADNLASGQAEEASRQFGQQAQMSSIEGMMSARNANEQSSEFQRRLMMDVMSGKLTARQAQEAAKQFGQQAEMAGLEGLMSTRNAEEQAAEFQRKLQLDVMSGKITARQAEEASRQFAQQAQFTGLEGQMAARQQTAGQEAAAKDAQFTALQGQGTAAQQQAALAEQQKNMQLTNLAAMQQAGQQQQDTQLAKQEYPLDIAAKESNILAPMTGAAIQTKDSEPSLAQNILGGVTAAAGIATGLGYAEGGIVYIPRRSIRFNGGGLADLEPQYYSGYEY